MRVVEGHCFRKPRDAGFRSAVSRALLSRDDTQNRADIDDCATIRCAKMRQSRARNLKCARQVRCDDVVPILVRCLVCRRHNNGACVIDHDMQGAKMFHRRRQCSFHRFVIHHIAGYRRCLTSGSFNLANRRFQRCLPASCDRDGRTLPGEKEGAGSADAGAAAGNKDPCPKVAAPSERLARLIRSRKASIRRRADASNRTQFNSIADIWPVSRLPGSKAASIIEGP